MSTNDDANGVDGNEPDEKETKILEAIDNIRGVKRNRPCFNTILGYVRRHGNDIDMAELKSRIEDMLHRKVIYDGGKDNLESFYRWSHYSSKGDDTSKSDETSITEIQGEKHCETLQ